MVNTNHNKYISTPDWFTESNSKTSNIVDGQNRPNGQIFFPQYTHNENEWDILLYNKFVLSPFEYGNEILTVKDTAITGKNNPSALGSTIDDTEWSASDYMPIASGSSLVINSSKHNEYGIAFYNEQHIALSGKNFIEYDYTIIVPNSACYFRICCKNSFTGFFVKGFTARNYDKDELTLSDKNTNDYLQLNSEIPEGISKVSVDDDSLQLLVQNPLQLSKDDNNVIKLSLDYSSLKNDINDMFVWDKTLSAYGYDPITKCAYSYINGEQQFIKDDNGNLIPVMTDDITLWHYDINESDKWIIKTTKPRLQILDGLIEYDKDYDCFFFHKSIVTSGGIVMYADDKSADIPTIMDSLPIATDNSAGIASFDSDQFILDNGRVSINDNWLGQVQNGIGFNLYSSDEYEIK